MFQIILVSAFALLMGCQKQSNSDWLSAEGLSLYAPEKLELALERQKLSLESRLLTLQSLWISLKSSYVGYSTKKHLIGRSVDEVMTECLAEENKYPSPNFSFEFDGRLRKCIAALKDGHMSLRKMSRSLRVLSPVMNLEKIDNKFYVSEINDSLFQELVRRQIISEEIAFAFRLGVEVLSFNGTAISEAVENMKVYSSASGDQSRLREATELLFGRSFAYPKSSTHKIIFKSLQSEATIEIELPWLFQSRIDSDNLETPALLKRTGIQKGLADYGLQTAVPKGLRFNENLFPLDNWREFENLEDQELLATVGVIPARVTQGEELCYLRFSSFSIGSSAPDYKVRKKHARTEHNLLHELKEFLQQCEQDKKKLILDLRSNPGGNAVFAESFANLLAKKTDALFARGQSLHLRSGLVPFFQRSIIPEASDNIRSRLWLEGLVSESGSIADVSPWLIFHRKSQTRAAFEGPLLTLTSAHCISACENTVHFLRLTERGTIAGEETHGTGFGFASNSEAQTLWRDPMNMFQLDIPNNAFSYFSTSGHPLAEDTEFAAFTREVSPEELTENRPRQVHHLIATTINDIQKSWMDYKARVLELTRGL